MFLLLLLLLLLFPLKKHTSAVFCLSHATNKSILRNF
jgi:hypothetical protein